MASTTGTGKLKKPSVEPIDELIQPGHSVKRAKMTEIESSADKLCQLREFINYNPNNSEAHYELGLVLYQQGRFAECINSMDQALKLNASLQMEKASDIKLNATMAMKVIDEGLKRQGVEKFARH